MMKVIGAFLYTGGNHALEIEAKNWRLSVPVAQSVKLNPYVEDPATDLRARCSKGLKILISIFPKTLEISLISIGSWTLRSDCTTAGSSRDQLADSHFLNSAYLVRDTRLKLIVLPRHTRSPIVYIAALETPLPVS